MNPCVLIPHFEHSELLPGVIADLERFGLPVIVVDDGSGTAARNRLGELADSCDWLEVVYRPSNGGKGAALKTGYRRAVERGFSHAVQVDADQQHDLDDIPKFLDALAAAPDTLILGVPMFDDSVPTSRLYGRQISVAMVWLVTLSKAIPDPLCGFRGVPLAAALRVIDEVSTGDRMDFDPEFAVRMLWQRTPIDRIPTRISYDPSNHVSHFEMLRDNALLSGMYTRLTLSMLWRLPSLLSHPTPTSAGTVENRLP
jgi:glycosyltransferase involved in cell wall biosynthesis